MLRPKREKSFKFQLTWTNIYGNHCVRDRKSRVISNFFFRMLHSRNIRKSVTIRYQIRLLFRSSDHGISRAVTFQLLNRFWFAYFTFILAMYIHFYMGVYAKRFIFRILFFWLNYSSTFGFNFIPSRHSFYAILDVLRRYKLLQHTWFL